MIEVELKSVVPDIVQCRGRLEAAGAVLSFAGRLEDRRYDLKDRSLTQRDHVLRTRAYRDAAGAPVNAELGWKGPTEYVDGYKQREEIGVRVDEPGALDAILDRIGLEVTMAIDRDVWQYELEGAIVRLERYPRMDDLVEVEGSPAAIERAIAVIALPRAGFTSERLPAFVQRYEQRTGERAALSEAALSGAVTYDMDNA
jgi:adenylate cyclase class IV